MRGWAQKLNIVLAIAILLMASFTVLPAKAGGSCIASVDPNTTEPASNGSFDISVTNTGSSDINWVDITVPGYFTYAGNSINGWTTADHDGGTTITGNTITPGHSAILNISAVVDVLNASNLNWQIKADESGGAEPVNCSGASTSINGYLPRYSPTAVSNVAVSSITSSQATITWNSDFASTSLVYFGASIDYNHWSNYDTNLTTSHSVTITGLSSETGYHFQVAGSDGNGSFAYSEDNTFLTEKSQASNNNNNGSNNKILGGGIQILSTPAEKTPPAISLNASERVFKSVPTLSGTASDNVALARIQYSTDGGQNWLPVDQATGLGSKSATFSFTPIGLEDGVYNILARAIDTSGNISTTPVKDIVIARLDPAIGGNLFALGSQILMPDSTGTITTLAGMDTKITTSAVGGPVNVYLVATSLDGKKRQTFNLTKSVDTGLWSGIVSVSQPGKYKLVAYAINGADVKTSRDLNILNVLAASKTTDHKNSKTVVSKVTVYYYESQSQKWVVWGADAYNQSNPQTTDKWGNFNIYLPPGKYYLQASAPGYQTLISRIFSIEKTKPISVNLELNHLYQLRLGSLRLTLPTLSAKYIDIMVKPASSIQRSSDNLINKQLPGFNLASTAGGDINPTNLLGKPTVITVGSTWSPAVQEQLNTLSNLQSNKNINIVPIALHENLSKIQAYLAISNLNLEWIVDPDGTITNSFNIQSLPTHYFVNRKGIVTKVVTGALDKQQILSYLGSL